LIVAERRMDNATRGGNRLLASETAEKPRVTPSQGSGERGAQPAQPPALDALPPELLTDEIYRAAAERSAPWHVRHASRVRIAAIVGITGGLAGLALYGWSTLRPTELDKLQIALPARTSAGLVEPAAVQPPPAVVPSATVPTRVQPAPKPASPPPQPRIEAAIPLRPSANRTPVTHTRRADASTPAAAAVAAPAAAPSQPKAEPKPNCAEGVAALGLCK
jgi:hypothetical protein